MFLVWMAWCTEMRKRLPSQRSCAFTSRKVGPFSFSNKEFYFVCGTLERKKYFQAKSGKGAQMQFRFLSSARFPRVLSLIYENYCCESSFCWKRNDRATNEGLLRDELMEKEHSFILWEYILCKIWKCVIPQFRNFVSLVPVFRGAGKWISFLEAPIPIRLTRCRFPFSRQKMLIMLYSPSRSILLAQSSLHLSYFELHFPWDMTRVESMHPI